jgi:hypothetical protein
MPTSDSCKDESPGLRATRVWSRLTTAIDLPRQLDASRHRDASGVATATRAGAGSYATRLILMGDWCDSRHHTTKRWVRYSFASARGWQCHTGAIPRLGISRVFIRALYSRRLMGDPEGGGPGTFGWASSSEEDFLSKRLRNAIIPINTSDTKPMPTDTSIEAAGQLT